ncbi:MAG: hypothetical protein ACU833_05560 [Gammaproteobacteria bacterium]
MIQFDRQKKIKAFAATVFLLCAGLLDASVTRLAGSLNHVPVETEKDGRNTGQEWDRGKLSRMIDRTRQTLGIYDDADYWGDLAAFLYRQAANQGEFSSAGKSSLKAARYALEQSLSRSPANSFLWYRLSVVMTYQHERENKIVDALLMSLLTGPYEPGFMLNRLRFCLLYFDTFPLDERGLLAAQIAAAWRLSRQGLTSMLSKTPDSWDSVKQLLKATEPLMLKEMVIAVEKSG